VSRHDGVGTDFGTRRRVGGINVGISGAFARRPRSPILTSRRESMARGIPSLFGSSFRAFL
jgi:hypothetical protein